MARPEDWPRTYGRCKEPGCNDRRGYRDKVASVDEKVVGHVTRRVYHCECDAGHAWVISSASFVAHDMS